MACCVPAMVVSVISKRSAACAGIAATAMLVISRMMGHMVGQLLLGAHSIASGGGGPSRRVFAPGFERVALPPVKAVEIELEHSTPGQNNVTFRARHSRPLPAVDVKKGRHIRMLYKIPRLNSLRWPLALACALLASCDDVRRGCFDCGHIAPREFSAGVVSADFNGDGFADVVALSLVLPPVSGSPSNIKAYLSTAAGVFAAPVFTPDGSNPLYLAAADLNGDGL